MSITETLYSCYLEVKNHVVKVEGNMEDNSMGKIKSTKGQAMIYKTQRRTLKIEGHLILICS